MELAKFKQAVRKRLERIDAACVSLGEPGDVIQCPWSAVADSGSGYYVMGFNPGGSGGKHLCDTIRTISRDGSPTQQAPEKKYWTTLGHLANALGFGTDWYQQLFVTNLFPNSSRSVRTWKPAGRQSLLACADAIWPIHELMLSIVRPRFIIVSGISHGTSAFWLLWNKFRELHQMRTWDETMSDVTRGRDPQVKSFSIDGFPVLGADRLPRVTFIGVRHLSYGGPKHPDAVVDLVQAERRLG